MKKRVFFSKIDVSLSERSFKICSAKNVSSFIEDAIDFHRAFPTFVATRLPCSRPVTMPAIVEIFRTKAQTAPSLTSFRPGGREWIIRSSVHASCCTSWGRTGVRKRMCARNSQFSTGTTTTTTTEGRLALSPQRFHFSKPRFFKSSQIAPTILWRCDPGVSESLVSRVSDRVTSLTFMALRSIGSSFWEIHPLPWKNYKYYR